MAINIKQIFKEEEPIQMLKILGIKKYIIMTEENTSQGCRLKNTDGTSNHFVEEINQN